MHESKIYVFINMQGNTGVKDLNRMAMDYEIMRAYEF